MLWNGMEGNKEWKENFSIEYGIGKVWNGIEDFINGMEKVFHTSTHFPYLLILRLFLYKVQSIKLPLISCAKSCKKKVVKSLIKRKG